MPTVLVSFIGATKREDEGVDPAHLRYRTTCYGFPSEGEHPESSVETPLFGAALLRRLAEVGRPVSRWLVLGTDQSMWDALAEAVPLEERGRLPRELFQRVGQAFNVETRTTPEDADAVLAEWEQVIEAAIGVDCLCRRVGTGRTEDSWQALWRALAEAVREGDDLVLDITNGLRHQPVMAAFMVMLLRRLCRVGKVDLYYGAFELRDDPKDPHSLSPVLYLPLSNRLLEATEAIATLEYTGNFAPLARSVALPEATRAEIAAVAFKDETNQEARAEAQAVLQALSTPFADAVDDDLVPWLREPLQWVAGQTLARRLARKADFAFRHQQYFKAVALLYEAFAVAGVLKMYGSGQEMVYQNRETVMRQLPDDRTLLTRAQGELLKDVKALRNAVMHGTPTTRPQVRRALQWPQGPSTGAAAPRDFEQLFRRGQDLLNTLIKAWGL
jgi:cell division protein DivIC